MEERQFLGIHGLLAAKFKSQEEQLDICRISIDRYEDNLNKYLYLVELQVTKRDKGTIDSVNLIIDGFWILGFWVYGEDNPGIDKDGKRHCLKTGGFLHDFGKNSSW